MSLLNLKLDGKSEEPNLGNLLHCTSPFHNVKLECHYMFCTWFEMHGLLCAPKKLKFISNARKTFLCSFTCGNTVIASFHIYISEFHNRPPILGIGIGFNIT